MTTKKEKTGVFIPVLFALFFFRLSLSVNPFCAYDLHTVLFFCIRVFYRAFPTFIPVWLYTARSSAHAMHLAFLLPAAPVLAYTRYCSPCRYPVHDRRSIPALDADGLPSPGTRHEMRPCQLLRSNRLCSRQALNGLAVHQSKSRSFQDQTTRQPVLCPLRAGSSTTTTHGLGTPARSVAQAACLRKPKNPANKRIENSAAFQSTFLADSILFQTHSRA